MSKVVACKTDAVEEGDVLQFFPDDGRAPLAIYQLDGEFYATDDTCSHGQASLAEGLVEDGSIICPFHDGGFDIKTGKPTAPPCVIPIKSYPVNVEGESVFVDLSD